jgi:hypothetical protein
MYIVSVLLHIGNSNVRIIYTTLHILVPGLHNRWSYIESDTLDKQNVRP